MLLLTPPVAVSGCLPTCCKHLLSRSYSILLLLLLQFRPHQSPVFYGGDFTGRAKDHLARVPLSQTKTSIPPEALAAVKPTILIIQGGWYVPENYEQLTIALEKAGYEVHCPRLPTTNQVCVFPKKCSLQPTPS